MRRAAALLVVFAMLASFAACAGRSGKYTLVSVPDKLQIDAASLSEDADNLMPIGDRTPLIAAIPEEDLYIYCTDPTIVAGVLVKYAGRIQYFSWNFTPQIADPHVRMVDFNRDGVRDIAFTYCDTANEMVYNENLHILLAEDGQLRDKMYRWETLAMDATIGLAVDDLGGGQFSATLDGKDYPFTLENDGFGKCLGTVARQYADFTLGDTITASVKPGIVFENLQEPVYDVLLCTGTVVVRDDALRLDDLHVTMQ